MEIIKKKSRAGCKKLNLNFFKKESTNKASNKHLAGGVVTHLEEVSEPFVTSQKCLYIHALLNMTGQLPT